MFQTDNMFGGGQGETPHKMTVSSLVQQQNKFPNKRMTSHIHCKTMPPTITLRDVSPPNTLHHLRNL